MDLKEMQELRAARLKESCGRLMQASATYTPAGVCLLKRAVPALSEGIKKYVAECKSRRGVRPTAYEWLSRIPAEVASLIVCRRILDCVAVTINYTSLCLGVGRLVCDEMDLRRARRLNDEVGGRLKKIARNRASKVRRQKLAKDEAKAAGLTFAQRVTCLRVGQVCVGLFIDHTGLIETKMVSHPTLPGKRLTRVAATQGLLDWIREYHDKVPALLPVWMPLAEPPIHWVSSTGGGYGAAGHGGRLIASGQPEQREAFDAGRGADCLKALNAIQDVPWAVDADVLEVAKAIWAEGHGQAGLPRREPTPFPPRPEPWVDGSVEARNWKRQAAAVATMNDEAKSRAVGTAKTIWAADRMLRAGRIWFPCQFDFRGRVYPRPGSLNPQGADLARGLLRFADGRPMGSSASSGRWLMIHGANCFGIDKVSFEQRLQWVGDNERLILASGEDPLSERWWTSADEPWQFLAFCFEFWRWKQEGDSFISRLPVSVDGSNNGLQLYALLTGDARLATETNVLPSDSPRDIYGVVASRATAALREVASGPAGDAQVSADWLLHTAYPNGLPRKMVKRPVMTLPYGVTRYSAKRYVADFIRADCAERGLAMPVGLNHYAMLSTAGDAVWGVISSFVGPALDCMEWVRGLATKCAEVQKPMVWEAPSGFPVVMRYHKGRTREIQTVVGDRMRYIKIEEHLPEICHKRMASGSAPNFVHSLDASVLVMAVNKAQERGLFALSVVHDSYATVAPDMEALGQCIREAVVDVFDSKPLETLRNAVQETVNAPVSPYQSADEFNIRQVLSSPYFFA